MEPTHTNGDETIGDMTEALRYIASSYADYVDRLVLRTEAAQISLSTPRTVYINRQALRAAVAASRTRPRTHHQPSKRLKSSKF
jgi:hypothetical protein